MFAIQRREQILDRLRSSGSVTVAELADRFDVGELTIRRDLTALADKGLVTRVHGGATIRSDLDTSVRSSSGGALYRIGMIVPTLNFYWPTVITGARAAAAELGVELVVRGASYDPTDQRRQIHALADSGTVHGLIVAPESHEQDGAAMLSWLDRLELPVILAERRVPHGLLLERLEWVGTDHYLGAALAVRHLNDKGHRRIGLVLPPMSPTSVDLRAGWHRAVLDLGIEEGPELELALNRTDGAETDAALHNIISSCRETGTSALLVHSDIQAMRLVDFCFDTGIRIPEDLAIVAYDDEIASNNQTPITALRPPKAEVGRRAIEMMVARLGRSKEHVVQRTMLLPTLMPRSST